MTAQDTLETETITKEDADNRAWSYFGKGVTLGGLLFGSAAFVTGALVWSQFHERSQIRENRYKDLRTYSREHLYSKDVNGDGIKDLILIPEFNGRKIFLGQEDGTYLPFEQWKEEQRKLVNSKNKGTLDSKVKAIEVEASKITEKK